MRPSRAGESANIKSGGRIRRFRQVFAHRGDRDDQPDPADTQRGR
jgi:hypothetical protein